MLQQSRQFQTGKKMTDWFSQVVSIRDKAIYVNIRPHRSIADTVYPWIVKQGGVVSALDPNGDYPTMRARVYPKMVEPSKFPLTPYDPWKDTFHIAQFNERRSLVLEVELTFPKGVVVTAYFEMDVPSLVNRSFDKDGPLGKFKMRQRMRASVSYQMPEPAPVVLAKIATNHNKPTPNLDAFLEGIYVREGIRLQAALRRNFRDPDFVYTPYEKKFTRPMPDTASVTDLLGRCAFCTNSLPDRIHAFDAEGNRVKSNTRLGKLRAAST